MRALMLTLLLLALPLAAVADCGEPRGDCLDNAETCCASTIEIACLAVKYTPRCDWPGHMCVTPLAPSDCFTCIAAPCHQLPVPMQSCACCCVDPPCHMPVIAVTPVDPCVIAPCLTGGKHLIVGPCDCTNCVE